MQYYLVNDPMSGELACVKIVGRTISIPVNPENRDYQEYLAWVAEGNEPLPADD